MAEPHRTRKASAALRPERARSGPGTGGSLHHVPWRIFGPIAVVHITLLVLTLTRTLDPLFNDAQHRFGPGTDFYAYYYAGKGWLAGEGMYGHGPGWGFRYHPLFAATVGALLSLLSESAAFGAWVFLQAAAFWGVLVLMWRRLGGTRVFVACAWLLALDRSAHTSDRRTLRHGVPPSRLARPDLEVPLPLP
jgi:hypothetical protein